MPTLPQFPTNTEPTKPIQYHSESPWNLFYPGFSCRYPTAIWTLVSTLLILFAYGIVSFYLIFRTDVIINKLKLENGFNQDTLQLNIHRSTILSISIIVIGGLIVANEIPNFCRLLFSYYQQKRMTQGLQDPGISHIVMSGAKIIVGILMLTNQRQIVRFIEWKRRT